MSLFCSGSLSACLRSVFLHFTHKTPKLIVIHRTIVAYKSRSLAFEETYGPSHNDTKSQGDLLAFSRKFDAAWLPPPRNGSRVVEWKPEQSYPYKIPGGISRAAHYPSPINQIWKVACPEVPTKLRKLFLDKKEQMFYMTSLCNAVSKFNFPFIKVFIVRQ